MEALCIVQSQFNLSVDYLKVISIGTWKFMLIVDTVRGKILEWEKIGEFGESWALRQYFTRQLFLFRIFQLG